MPASARHHARATETRMLRLCAEKGLRLTGQRKLIVKVLAGLADHPDVEELHRRAQALDPRISLATVYRTMRLFADEGLLVSHEFRDGRSRFELAGGDHHDHLIDLASGRVIEFRSPEIERIQAEIAARHGFRIVDHRLEIYVAPLDEEDSEA